MRWGDGVKLFVRVLTVAVCVLAVAARAEAADPEGYVVLGFEDRAAGEGLKWMSLALPVALGEKLEAHPGLVAKYDGLVLPPGAPPPSDGAEGAKAVAQVATAAGARWALTGRFARPNWKLEITLILWSVEQGVAKEVGRKTGVKDFAETSALLDELALPLLQQAGRAVPASALPAVTRVQTKDFYAFTLYGRGYAALHGLGAKPDLEKAKKTLERALLIDPKQAEAHRALALVYDAMNQPAKAEGRRSYALDLRPDYFAPLRALALAAVKRGARDEARPLLKRALAARPTDDEVRFAYGSLLWEDGELEDARTELERVVASRPDHLAARRVLVLVHATQGAGEELARELEVITKLAPEDEAARLDLGAAYQSLGRDADAIETYLGVAKKNPKQVQAMKLLGDLYRARGDQAASIRWYQSALTANQNDPRPYFLLGGAYVEAGRDKDAIGIYLRAQRFSRYRGEAYTNVGALYLRQDMVEKALWYLQRAAAILPRSFKARYNYGVALTRSKQREKALGELAVALELDPDDPDVHFARGAALLGLGRLDEAEKSFQDAVKLDPKHEDARHDLRLIEEMRRRAREGEIERD